MKSNAIWVLFFLEGSKKQFKSLSVCFENNSIGCTIIFKNNLTFLGIIYYLHAAYFFNQYCTKKCFKYLI